MKKNQKTLSIYHRYIFFIIIFSFLVLSIQISSATLPRLFIMDSIISNNSIWLVGEHGMILNSNDGNQWIQSDIKFDRLLTSITKNTNNHLAVAGYDASIFISENNGKTWEQFYRNSDIGKHVFDIEYVDNDKLIAVGSYGLYLSSTDSGINWQLSSLPIHNVDEYQHAEIDVKDLHLNSISFSQNHKSIAIAAESGYVYISNNRGNDYKVIKSPYNGSFFGSEFINDSTILFYGLRGRIYLFHTNTNQWQEIDSDTQEILHSSYMDENDIYIIGYGSSILKVNISTLDVGKETSDSNKNFTSFLKFKDQYYLTSDKGIETFR